MAVARERRSPGAALAKRRGKREALSRERIEEAALELIEREGMEGFSTRKLAAELGCEAMSIYHYFPSKAHLLDALLDRVVGGMPPDDPALPWRERLKQSVLAYRAQAHRYPRFFQFAVLHRHNTRVGLAWLERVLGILREGGLDAETTARFFRAIGYYIMGGMLDETSGYGRGHTAAEPVPAEEVARDFPNVVAVNPYFKPSEHEATFMLGLDTLFDRLEKAAETAARNGRERGPSAPKAKRAAVRPASRRATASRSSSR